MPSTEPFRAADQYSNSSLSHGITVPGKAAETECIGGKSAERCLTTDRQRWQRTSNHNRSTNDISLLDKSRTDFRSSDKVSPMHILELSVHVYLTGPKKVSRGHRSLRRNGRRASQSLPGTPPSLKDRLWQKMRPKRAWEKSHDHGLSCHSQPRLLSSQDPQWRRRVRESTQIDSSSEDASPLFYTPLESQGTKSLLMAGMLMATEELDRLSTGARQKERQDATI